MEQGTNPPGNCASSCHKTEAITYALSLTAITDYMVYPIIIVRHFQETMRLDFPRRPNERCFGAQWYGGWKPRHRLAQLSCDVTKLTSDKLERQRDLRLAASVIRALFQSFNVGDVVTIDIITGIACVVACRRPHQGPIPPHLPGRAPGFFMPAEPRSERGPQADLRLSDHGSPGLNDYHCFIYAGPSGRQGKLAGQTWPLRLPCGQKLSSDLRAFITKAFRFVSSYFCKLWIIPNGLQKLLYRDYDTNSSVDSALSAIILDNYVFRQVWNIKVPMHEPKQIKLRTKGNS